MANGFKFELVSPEKLLVSAEATAVVIPGSEGDMTVMANHAPTMTSIRPGVIAVTDTSGKTERYVVFGGFADILPEGCTVLAEWAAEAGTVSAADIRVRIEAARKALEEAHGDDGKQKAQEFLDQLTTLEGTVVPA
jgi:ATP synthase, F1 epsilon subunit (delta in mitochondria)